MARSAVKKGVLHDIVAQHKKLLMPQLKSYLNQTPHTRAVFAVSSLTVPVVATVGRGRLSQGHPTRALLCVFGARLCTRGYPGFACIHAHLTINPSTGWFTFPPAVPLSPAVPFCTRVSTVMKPPLGREEVVLNF